MLLAEAHDGITFIRMARRLAGRAVFWTGAYLVDDLLIDCGPPATAAELARFLAGRPLTQVLVTHHHEDHIGAAALLQAARGVRVRAHERALLAMRHGFPQQPYRLLAWGRAARVSAEALPAEIRHGPLTLQVVPTPGHSPDHACFFEPERRWLFTGDLFLAERLRFLRADEDLSGLIASLDAVCRLPAQRVFCAHRGPVRGGLDALRRKAENLRLLRERVLGLLGQGLSEAQVTRRVVGREGAMSWLSRGHFAARNFVRVLSRGAAAPGE